MSDKYETNLLKPNSPYSKENNRLILILLVIWAVTVFGFQTTLWLLEEPTPEPALVAFDEAWPAYKSGTASPAQTTAVAKAYLTVLGKYVSARLNDDLTGGFTTLAMGLGAPIGDPDAVAKTVGVADEPLLARVVPHALNDNATVNMDAIPGLMAKYMTHNQSVLTDMRVLGFPFHYFFSAVLTLIIFCLICLYYCIKIESINAKHGLEAGE